MNITEYKVGKEEYQIYYGKATIRDNYYIVNADERFYHLIGKKSGFPMPELLHADDVQVFLDATEKMDEEPQCILVRLLTEIDTYRYVYMKMYYNGRIVQGARSYDIEVSDIMAITDRYKESSGLVAKYRQLMSLHDGVFFEYSYDNDMLEIYEYYHGRARRLYYKNLSEAMEEVSRDSHFSAKQKEEFVALGEMIHKRIDCFKLSLDADVFAEYMQGVRFECNCTVLYREDVHYKVVGLVHYVGKNKPQKSYYLSESANDPATGLLNKRAINEYALERIQNCEKGGYLVLIDIDDFKQVNDKFGHMFGDQVIATSAEIFRSVTQTRGMAGRFGGDEFMLVLENVPTEEDLRRIMKVIQKHAQWAFVEKEGFNIGFSCGISKFPEDGKTYEELFKKADKALYIAKDKGKNRYIIYREQLHGSLEDKDDSGRSVGLKATISDADKHALIADDVIRLYRDGKNAISGVMQDMQTYFDIDGIAIYTGEDMHRTYSRGNYVHPIEKLSFIFEEDYLEMFDENGYYIESIIDHLTKKSPLAYEMHVKQESGKFIQYVIKEDDKPKVVIAFDFFNRSPKFGTTDLGMMKSMCKILAEVAK